jgi:hypothetical protein
MSYNDPKTTIFLCPSEGLTATRLALPQPSSDHGAARVCGLLAGEELLEAVQQDDLDGNIGGPGSRLIR